MSGNKKFNIRVEINKGCSIPECESTDDFYTVHVHPNGVESKIVRPLFESMANAHAEYRISQHGDTPAGAVVKLDWLYCIGDDDDYEPTEDLEYPEDFEPFHAAHTILHAIAETNPGPTCATLLLEKATAGAFWKFLPGLPPCIEEITVGMCEADSVPPAVWESLPRLQKIMVYTSRMEDGEIGPEVIFERPRNDEPKAAKRARTEVIDFATSTSKVFLVPAFEEEANNAQTFQIADERPVKFRAVVIDEIRVDETHSLIEGPVTTLRPTADLRHLIDMVYATEDSVKRSGVKPNIDASVVTGTSVWGPAVFVKK